MSIITKTGDAGTTGLMYNCRVSKCHPRVEAYGCVDELNAALGLVRATAKQDDVRTLIHDLQKELVTVMGELATGVADLPRYERDGYPRVTHAMTARIEKSALELEARKVSPGDWATPGATLNAAALDLARTTCRRAERRVCALHEASQLENAEIIVYLNRLSDLLWLLARQVEGPKAE
jgi:cob(I)alamin adenosyltransferase